jgi:cardiolipin synthase (CMP-forming)
MWYKNIKWNIPNILSAYRLLMCPVILFLIYIKLENIFVVLFCINLFTDIADGFIARRFNMQTESGAVLDSMADIGSYIIAIYGIVQFHAYIFSDYGYWLWIFVILYVLTLIVPQVHYGRPTAGLHLYSSKIGGYAQGIFLVTLFAYKMVPWLFYTAMCIGYYSEIEGIIINCIARVPHLNAKTIFHFFKNYNVTSNE